MASLCLFRQLKPQIIGRRYIHRWVSATLMKLKMRRIEVGPEPLTHRSTKLPWNYNAELFAFCKRLNEEFSDDTLRAALTHASYIEQETRSRKELGIEEPISLQENSQLVESGSRLMDSYVKRYLRLTHPYLPEEGICAVHKFLTSDDILSYVSFNIGTKDLVLCEDFPPTKETLAATLKAIVGALIKESGEARAIVFVQDFVLTQLVGRDVQEMWTIINPMGILADILRREGRGEPESRLLRESGRLTILSVYNVGIYSDRKMIGSSGGESLPTAEEMAARDALRRMFRLTERKEALPFGKKGRDIKLPNEATNPSVREWTFQLAEKCAAAARS